MNNQEKVEEKNSEETKDESSIKDENLMGEKEINQEQIKNDNPPLPQYTSISQQMPKKQPKTLEIFLLLNKIGNGSFGQVYKVKQKKTGEVFAAKISFQNFEEDTDNSILDLSREVNIISKLNHPSILKFIYFSPKNFKGKTKPVIITEFANNGSLDKLIEKSRENPKNNELTDTKKLIIIYGIAEAMSYLHLHDIIHRDLKPANILLDDYLFPKVADFGLSKINHSNQSMTINTIDNSIKGTPIYMSPEIWEKTFYSKSSDVYAFSLIVYEIMTLEKPFNNENIFMLPLKILKGQRPEFNTQIPSAYQKLIESCWSQNPNNRPTFDQILIQLSRDKGFISDSVNEEEFEQYVKYIKSYKASFDSEKNYTYFNKFNKTKQFNKIKINDEKINENIRRLKVDEMPINKYPFQDYIKLDKRSQKIIDSAVDNAENQLIVAKSLIEGYKNFPLNREVGLEYLLESINRDNKESIIYYCNLLIKGNIFPQNLTKAKKLIERLKNDKSTYLLLKGKINLKESKFNEAIINFKDSIELGNDQSMYEYAKMLYKGIGISIDKKESVIYFERSIEKGNLNAMYKLGKIIINDELEGKTKEEGINYIKSSADGGISKAMYYYYLLNSKEKNEISINFLQESADKGYSKSMYKYGVHLEEIEETCNVDYKEILQYLKKAGDKGIIDSIYEYGKILYNTYDQKEEENSEKITEACMYLKIAADNGNENAMSRYGRALLFGNGVPVDKVLALEYFKKGIERNIPSAMYCYAYMLQNGDGVPVNIDESVKYYKMAIDKGYINAMLSYACMLRDGNGIPVDKEEAKKYFKMAIDKGSSIAMNDYAHMLYDGKTVFTNKEEATKYYKMAISKGNTNAMSNYAYILFAEKDDSNGWFEYIKMASDHGNAFSTYICGFFLDTGNRGVKIDHKEALKYYKKAADKGIASAMVEYANMLLKGEVCERNTEEAIKYLKMANDKGDSRALLIYAKMLLRGYGVKANIEEAVKYFKMCIDKGNSEAMDYYADILFYGKGTIKPNKQEAIKYYKLASDAGLSSATHSYAKILENGDGVPANKEEAFKYYKMLADNENASGMYDYARMLENGDVVPANKKEAIKYYKLASDEGNSDAMFKYACMLENGDGVPVDKEKAINLYRLSANEGNINAIKYYTNIVNKNDEFDNIDQECITKIVQKSNKSKRKERRKSFCSLKIINLNTFKELNDECKNLILRAENDDNDLNDDDLKFYVAQSFIQGTNNFPQNVEIGLKYLQKSCEKLNIDAIKSYSKILHEGILIERNDKKALDLLNEIPYIYQHSIPKLELAKTILSNESFDVNISTSKNNINYILAKKLCKKASEMLNTNAMLKYGKLCMYEKKNKFGEIHLNIDEAFDYYKLASDRGNSEAMTFYGQLLEFGTVCHKKNVEKAVEYYKMSYERRSFSGYARYGNALIKGLGGIEKNEKEGLRLIKISVDNNNIIGINIYSACLYNGLQELNKNINLAFEYSKRAANLGSAAALTNIGYYYQYGECVEKNINEAIKYYKKGIEQGSFNSSYYLGNLLIESDDKSLIDQGYKYIKYAAENGNINAMSDYIENMTFYNSVDFNSDDLIKFLKIGIFFNDEYIFQDLADLLSKGIYFPKDKVKAAKYYKKAADLGLEDSIDLYSQMLAIGIGVEKNPEEAEKYRQMLQD